LAVNAYTEIAMERDIDPLFIAALGGILALVLGCGL
jgi:hypothetical protein